MFGTPPVELCAVSIRERQDAGIGLGFLGDGVRDVANTAEAFVDRQTPIGKARLAHRCNLCSAMRARKERV